MPLTRDGPTSIGPNNPCRIHDHRVEAGVDHPANLGLSGGLGPVIDGPVCGGGAGALLVETITGPSQVEGVD